MICNFPWKRDYPESGCQRPARRQRRVKKDHEEMQVMPSFVVFARNKN
jgi:hypothetical protein